MGKPAQQLTKAIRDYLTLNGWFVWRGGSTASRNKDGGFYITGQPGSPDLYAIKCDNNWIDMRVDIVGIEVKAGKDRVSPMQLAFHQSFAKHGGQIIVARTLQDVISALGGAARGQETVSGRPE